MSVLFEKVLVANRGEIARRVMRTCRRLGIRTVAVYSEADASAPHVAEADESVLIGPAPPKDSYLSIPAILEAIEKTGARAVHPGYGFLSEKSAFARAVAERGVTFIGPSPEVLDAFGDKMKARHVALAAKTSPVPGTDEPIAIDTPEGVAHAKAVAARVGYPVVVKAVGGGGGIGMQIVREEAGMERALTSCSDRGKASFADARVYLERYVSQPRHIEVQVMCDRHGNAYALGERECSVQRRHQKIIEESPSAAPFFQGEEGARRRRDLFDAALRVVKSVGYVGAGTCEFIADASGDLFFLEVNARLQVEHPVTEMVTGIDIVKEQTRIAAGERLSFKQSEVTFTGHSIECRINAEDPETFVPSPGLIHVFSVPGGPGVRVETFAHSDCLISPYYDSMIAKIIVHGRDRQEAIARMKRTLEMTVIEGIKTSIPLHLKIISDPEFIAGKLSTSFMDRFLTRPNTGRLAEAV